MSKSSKRTSKSRRRTQRAANLGEAQISDTAPCQPTEPTHSAHYEIKVEGRLDARWTAWFDGMTVTALNGETLIAGPVVDQSKLRGIINKLWDLNLVLVSVKKVRRACQLLGTPSQRW